MSGGIPTRDLRAFLAAAVEVMRDRGLVEELLRLCERNERALEMVQSERAELAIEKEEVRRGIARERADQEERLRVARVQWANEEALRRKKLDAAECEFERKRGWTNGKAVPDEAVRSTAA
jgi:hypothetical protein